MKDFFDRVLPESRDTQKNSIEFNATLLPNGEVSLGEVFGDAFQG